MEKKEMQQLFQRMSEEGFSFADDVIGTYGKGNPLYYKLISENEYLVLNHYNSKRKINMNGFDSWIATYLDKKHIGIKKPLGLKRVRQGFGIEDVF